MGFETLHTDTMMIEMENHGVLPMGFETISIIAPCRKRFLSWSTPYGI